MPFIFHLKPFCRATGSPGLPFLYDDDVLRFGSADVYKNKIFIKRVLAR